jgi:hypothetical protein
MSGQGAAGSAGMGFENPGGNAGTGVQQADNALTVRVEDVREMTIEIITLACAGDCADIEAVARGGHPPYTFEWEDGSTDAMRRVCLEAAAELTVSTTDTAIEADENGYEAQTARTEVSARVLDCADAGAQDGGVPGASCGQGAVETFRAFERQESRSTLEWADANGYLADYLAPSLGNAPLAIIASVQRTIELGSCTQLRLAGDAEGTRTFGWDDSVIVEYRSAPGAAVERRWYYGSVASVMHEPTSTSLISVVPPTVAGWDLDPPVFNPLPFGWEPLAIDLMTQVPAGVRSFELTIHLLDAGNVGGTTEVWVIPD